MIVKASGAKGLETEELVRAYFLRAGFYVVRGIKLRHGADDLSDLDLWLYERSATLARRRTVIDIKDKKIPQAAERLFFIKGVASVIGVEGAGVVTTDSRPLLRELARQSGVLWIDGADLQRLKVSTVLAETGRLTEEEFQAEIAQVDAGRGNRAFRNRIDEIKSAIADKFGPSCANGAIDGFQYFAREAMNAHPSSAPARLALRLSCLAASIGAAALDFASADSALRPVADRVAHIASVIRFGADAQSMMSNLRWAETAIREYLPNGAGQAGLVRDKVLSEFNSLPAEGLAEHVVKLSNSEKLFAVAKALEAAAYAQVPQSFDQLDVDSRGLLGALLDFSQISRAGFAKAFLPEQTALSNELEPALEGKPPTQKAKMREKGEAKKRTPKNSGKPPERLF